ncbi:MAG: hypothetical protein DCC67_05470 [Planctomycetota bacterium]|nr:MAG: hypothetical protein DCC67_05470 [Planctomycetota bacterium]
MFRPISPLAAQCLLAEAAASATGGRHEESLWYATADDRLVGAVAPAEAPPRWRLTIMRQTTDGRYLQQETHEGFEDVASAIQALAAALSRLAPP